MGFVDMLVYSIYNFHISNQKGNVLCDYENMREDYSRQITNTLPY